MQTQSPTYPDPALVAFMEEYLRTALQEQIEEKIEQQITEQVDVQIAEQIKNFVLLNENRSREIALMERVVRVEEELKALRETEGVHFAAIQKEMAVRFEAMNERITSFQKENATRFEAIQNDMNTRFEAMNERITAFQKENATRFEAVEKRFEVMDKRFSQLLWTILVGFTMLGSLIGWMGYLAR